VSAALALAVTMGAYAADPAKRFQSVAERVLERVGAKDHAGLDAYFNGAMREALPADRRAEVFGGIVAEYGAVRSLGTPRVSPPDTAVFPVSFERGRLDMRLVLDGEGKVAGLFFTPHVPEIPVPERHETPLGLPFQGRWLTVWGGDTPEVNAHHGHTNQRFAFDFLGVGENGKTHRGDGLANEDYYAFGRKILAPADGVVTEAIDGVADNAPGSMNQYSALGNAVVIEHRENEVSVLAHLRQGSVRVRKGDRVREGQILGVCGNSGNSSEPHLHYHLQNTPVVQDGTGVKVRFREVVVGAGGRTRTKKGFSPVKGDEIGPGGKP